MGEVSCDAPIFNNLEVDAATIFVQSSIPEQKQLEGAHTFPRVLVPSSEEKSSLSELLKGFAKEKSEIVAGLQECGAVLLRGFHVLTASDFNNVLEATGYEDFPYVGRGAARTVIVGRVSTTNMSQPPEVGIGYHNEMAYQVGHPRMVIFYCIEEQPAGVAGGATPIVQGHRVYQRLAKEMPEFLYAMETKGLTYNYPLEDAGKSQVYSWQTMFKTDDKVQAEARAEKLGIKLVWNQNGGASAVFGPRPGVKSHKGTKVWFNALDSIYEFQLFLRSKGDTTKLLTAVTFGDGEPIAENDIRACRGIMREEEVAFQWRKGDILILDNLAVMHSRQPFQPPRRVLASMCA